MGGVRRGHNKTKTKLTRDNNGKFGRVLKRAGSAVPKPVGVLAKRNKEVKIKKPQPVKIVKPSKVKHNHHVIANATISIDEDKADSSAGAVDEGVKALLDK